MSKVAHYLQEHLLGEVMTSPDARRYFATDTSVLTVAPAMVVYPRNEADVRKTARFAWQLAERGRVIPITARGAGTDQGGAALGAGIIMAFPAHMNRILELDDKSGVVAVEPGANYGKLQQSLKTHGRFLPPYPASLEYSTIGGAVANNASGEKSFKYGATRDYVRGLRVVLANGEVIETGRLAKRDLAKKLGLTSFEGEMYRAIDALIEENTELIDKMELEVTKNTAGYALSQVRQRDGSFDLTPLFVGSQGTLGIVTEAIMDTELYNARPALFVAHFSTIDLAQSAILELRGLSDGPSAIEMVDDHLLNLVDKINPNQIHDLEKPFPPVMLFVEFDNPERAQKKVLKKAEKILDRYASKVTLEMNPAAQDELWAIRHSSAVVTSHTEGRVKALPIIEDGVVPPQRWAEYLEEIYKLFARNHLQVAVWGHAGDGNLHVQPFLDLSQVGDRQTAFRLIDDYYTMLIELGGSTSAEHGDGRLRAPYLRKLYGDEVYGLFQKIKQICDPYNILNPGVKIDVELDDVKRMMRSSYTIEHLSDHLPRS
ncbi:MAG: FAD-binding oxidoreductase [Candidatus Saccharibacteria bacterium]